MYSIIWKILFQKYVSSHKGDMYLFKKGTFKETTMTFLHEMLFEIGAMKKWENIEWKDYQKQRININLSLFLLCFLWVLYEHDNRLQATDKFWKSPLFSFRLVDHSKIALHLHCQCVCWAK